MLDILAWLGKADSCQPDDSGVGASHLKYEVIWSSAGHLRSPALRFSSPNEVSAGHLS